MNKNSLIYNSRPIYNEPSITGDYEFGDSCILICDKCTSSYDILNCVSKIQDNGLLLEQIVILFDYSINTTLYLEELNHNVITIIDTYDIAEHLSTTGQITSFELNKISNSIDCLKKINNKIIENLKKPEKDRIEALLEKNVEDILSSKESKLIEETKTHNESVKEFETNKNTILQKKKRL